MRKGFTMIELIFVIVIIGILAAIAIPKLSATRDDAKNVSSVQNLATCVNDIGASYVATGKEETNTSACQQVINDGCFTVTPGAATDGNITVAKDASNTSTWCTDATASANKKKLIGGHSFGGSKIKF